MEEENSQAQQFRTDAVVTIKTLIGVNQNVEKFTIVEVNKRFNNNVKSFPTTKQGKDDLIKFIEGEIQL